MNNEPTNKMKIKNLRYNLALFMVSGSLTLHTISSAIAGGLNEVEELPTVETVTIENPQIPIAYNSQDTKETTIIEPIQEMVTIEKTYSGMKLTNEYEDELKKLCELYNIPYEIVLTIGYRESGGNWNNNGVISESGDYGVFQINECNLEYINENLGYSKEEILNDPIKNAEACMYLLKDILKRDDVDTVEEVFGMYNGWVGWKNKPLAVKYSSACCGIIDEYFPDFEYKKNQTTK